ncbi:MAG: DNA mismatch repair endonuclease MutL [Peptococcaceae bacterium]|nr:DNA mismatch repair endonuclease MutL [Peptococcaceae bacterium]
MKINLLPTELANQIAAGEVIERPSSAVKELVENAIDAKAENIGIDIRAGGLELIRVTDDGCGMDENDLRICLLRHATSKLLTLTDLFAIETLGFRGEALPSIAAVSAVTIRSRTKEAEEGYKLHCRGGEQVEFVPVGMPQGTIIEVGDLFFNTPARLKFMKSHSSEGQKVLQVVERLALSHPSVRFTLRVDDRVVLQTPGHDKLIDTALSVFGRDVAGQLNYFPPTPARSLTLSGVLGTPSLHRHNRMWQSFFLNGRYIENRRLAALLEQSYRTLIPAGRYPVAILHLTVPAHEVDVNVHPTKIEVRFRDEKAVFGEFMTVLRNQLYLMANKQAGRVAHHTSGPQSTVNPTFSYDFRDATTPLSIPFIKEQLTIIPPTSTYRLIGQVCLGYILIEKHGKLVIVDQHAAHERVLWEQLMEQDGGIQNLALPLSIDFGTLAHFLPRYLPYFASLGFSLEHFGGSSYVLRSLPATYMGNFDADILRDLVADMESDNLARGKEVLAAKVACRAAVKAGTKLSPSAMVELLDKLFETKLPFSCPHGRPIEVAFTEAELYKLFHPK